jgi:hypothetical protein
MTTDTDRHRRRCTRTLARRGYDEGEIVEAPDHSGGHSPFNIPRVVYYGQVDSIGPYTLTIPKFKVYSNLGESKIRELIGAGEIDSTVVGGRRMIIVPSYHAYVERCRAAPHDARRNRAGAVPAWGTKRIG